MFIITPRQRTTHGLPGAPWEDRKQPASGATVLRKVFFVFFLSLGVRRQVAPVAGARSCSCVLTKLAEGVKQPPHTPVDPRGRRRAGGGPTRTEHGPPCGRDTVWSSSFGFWAGKGHAAQRSGPCPENEVFALRDKTGTRQCLVAAAQFGWRRCDLVPDVLEFVVGPVRVGYGRCANLANRRGPESQSEGRFTRPRR